MLKGTVRHCQRVLLSPFQCGAAHQKLHHKGRVELQSLPCTATACTRRCVGNRHIFFYKPLHYQGNAHSPASRLSCSQPNTTLEPNRLSITRLEDRWVK